MTAIPMFDIGVWNAWILSLLFFVSMFVPNLFLSEEGKKGNKRLEGFVTSNKTEKLLAWSTHIVIWPVVILYSIFLPLKLGTVWLYVGLIIFVLGLAMNVMITISAASTPLGKPITEGVYRISRHPIYLAGFMIFAGIGIASASWVILLCALLWIVFLSIVMPDEERFCLDKYGDAYREYMNKTPRWIGLPKA